MTKPLALSIDKLESLAQQHAMKAIAALAEVVADESATPATRISAASAILQWGYGRPGGKAKPGDAGEQVIRLTWGEG